MALIKTILILSLVSILYQDIKDRKVYWFLFPLIGICTGTLHFYKTIPELFFISVLFNTTYISFIIAVTIIYTKLKLKKNINTVIGLGDILFLTALIFAFTPVPFMVLLTMAFIFSLTLHLFLLKHQSNKTVPLAGYMSLFFGLVFLGIWGGIVDTLYQI